MGRKVSKSLQISKATSLISGAMERQENINDTITSLEAFVNDDSLSGEAYANVKGYVNDVLIPINKALGMALKDEIVANRQVVNCCNAYLVGVDVLDEDYLKDETERLKRENADLQNDWWEYLPIVRQINFGRIMANDINISKLNKEIEKLDAYDSATQGLYEDATSQMEMVVQKINSIFSKPLFANGRYDYSGIDMKWAYCLVKRWDDNRTDINCKFEMFTLPKEQKDEIDKIINSDSSWEEKAEKIRRVYESYLFENVKDQNGNNPFLEYAATRKGFDDKTPDSIKEDAEKKLGIFLQNSGIDIRSVTRALSEDLLRAMPKNLNIVSKTNNFRKLVQTGAPADLKSNALNGSGNAKNSGTYCYDFSIWSRKWESTMRPDYLGNYSYGYIGADYWQGVDFDEVVKSVALIRAAIPSKKGDNFVKALSIYTVGMSGNSALRTLNPDKTDAEMFCLIGAGGAQLYGDVSSNINDAIGNRNLNDLINDLIENRNVDDLKKLPKEIQKEIKEYFESIYKGHWGDNEDDSKMISDGFNDYYAVNGIDKAQIIEEERKLQ